jgi:hypothetical protein
VAGDVVLGLEIGRYCGVAGVRQVTPDVNESGPLRLPVRVFVQVGAGRRRVTAKRIGVPMLPEASIARYSIWWRP